MIRPSSAMVAAALVAIPTSAGIYHLATSSSTKKSEKIETPEESIQREASEDAQELSKSLISQILETFSYDRIKSEDDRAKQIRVFVEETERIRGLFQSALDNYLLYQEEYENKNIKEILEQITDFTSIESTEGDIYWSKLAKARKEEVPEQLYLDDWDNSQSLSSVEHEAIKESIKKFCQDSSVANSHLGMYSPVRKEQEETQSYRIFTYYSYCTKESHYLNDKVNLWN